MDYADAAAAAAATAAERAGPSLLSLTASRDAARARWAGGGVLAGTARPRLGQAAATRCRPSRAAQHSTARRRRRGTSPARLTGCLAHASRHLSPPKPPTAMRTATVALSVARQPPLQPAVPPCVSTRAAELKRRLWRYVRFDSIE
ncbi:uncharacterized protein LOC126474589 [Schistocerca serialis cubense]|uniref:uncharacterized protein LOC126474589 n=1 Tax=Schistocerca serialis cubense TaxID=2023355 RepID=UPI00214F4414|nr:uncharacterized protein LOC126474589 [Schistocerca serialis cubense]